MRQATIVTLFLGASVVGAGCDCSGSMSTGCMSDNECMRGQTCRDHDCHDIVAEQCTDDDGDGAGIGTSCSAFDCDDTNPAVPAAAEVCGNGIDDDCSGVQDEGCPCVQAGVPVAPGATEACGMGMCAGTRACRADGTWGPCDPEHTPAPNESCNFQDDNCNGETDEGCCQGSERVCPFPDGATDIVFCSSNGVCR